MEVRRKAVKIALNMVTGRNVQEVVLFLKKQLAKTSEGDYEKVRIPVQHSTLILI
jgi:coatomer subunit beta